MTKIMNKEEIKLETGNVYLIKVYDNIREVYVEKITKTAYKFRVQRTNGTWYIDWIEKDWFQIKYQILEFLYSLKHPPRLEKENIISDLKLKNCPVCGGDGEVPDDTSTSGKKACPKCWGTGNIL